MGYMVRDDRVRPLWKGIVTTGTNLQHRLRETAGTSVPGIAVAVVDPDGVRDVVAVGKADLRDGLPASAEMVCPWFSMTKIVTATAAMRLTERGLLDLDAPLAPHVEQMRHLRPTTDAAKITARHLLSHSGGLANPIPVGWIHPPDRPGPDPDTFLDGLLSKHGKLRSQPGTRSSYSNLGTLVLGAAMANLAQTPFTELVRHDLLEPLGMHATGFGYSSDMEAHAATGYHPRRSPMRYMLHRWVIGPPMGRWLSLNRFLLDGQAYGGLIGTVTDAARFVQMHLRDGELDGVRVLDADHARAMREIRVDGKRFDLGLGWFRPSNARDADPPFVEHLGGGAGFFNVIRIYPTRDVGVAVMGNATKYDIDAVAALALT
ncbi:MAG: serine hydrolase domain-containing protein [Actinomycetota bacterium]